jgi:hypothetical protein
MEIRKERWRTMMKWTKINNNGDYFKFTDPGDKLEGRWRGPKEGKYGTLGIFDTVDGEKLFTLYAVLQDLVHFEKGQHLRLVYTGLGETKSGQEYKQFDIFIGEPDDDGAPAAQSSSGAYQATPQDVPF